MVVGKPKPSGRTVMKKIEKILESALQNMVKSDLEKIGFHNVLVTPWGWDEDEWGEEVWQCWADASSRPELGRGYTGRVDVRSRRGSYDIDYTGAAGIRMYL